MAEPPSIIVLRFCRECGRTDRIQSLVGKYHGHRGKRCYGAIHTATYILEHGSIVRAPERPYA